jgi:transketolase
MLEQKAQQIRQRIIERKFGLLASSLSCVEILTTIYYGYNKPFKCILSKGHAVATLYAILEDKGVLEWTDDLPTHPTRGIPGIEVSTGSLGSGLGIACGMALVNKETIFVVMGDGELNEGSAWESIMFAASRILSNIICIIDYNGLSATGRTQMGCLETKFNAFDWDVSGCDGHNCRYLKQTIDYVGFKPKVIIANTTKGKGIPSLEGKEDCHLRSI